MQDPLNVNIPLAGVDTTLPLLPEADYVLQVVESTIDANKDKTGLNWNLKLATTEPATSTDGRDVKPNFPVFTVCALQAREDSKDAEAFKRGLGQTIDAIFGTSKENRPDFTRELANSAVGNKVKAHVYLDEYPKGSGQFNNKIKNLKKAE